MAQNCIVYLKGGHREDLPGKDILFTGQKEFTFNPRPGNYDEKHGSGCVFSAALTANLSKGYPLRKSILRAKRFVEHYLEERS
jgi:hydroxymethylpyrimidine/phosphomethylpyrimidine kinase